jgi:hypothetical protein
MSKQLAWMADAKKDCVVTNSDSWDSPEIREAEARLAEAEAGLDQAIAAARKIDKAMPRAGMSKEDIVRIEAFARGTSAPSVLRELQKRIDNGELTWDEIAAGRHTDDKQVREALSVSTPDLRRAYGAWPDGDEAGALIIQSGLAHLALVRGVSTDDSADDADKAADKGADATE